MRKYLDNVISTAYIISIGLAVLFYSLTDFWPSYCQISTDLDKILHKPTCIVVWMWADIDRDQRVGGSSPNLNDYVFFCNIVTHSKSYIETTDRRDFGGKPSKWRWGRLLSWKIPEFYSVGGARSKNSIFRVFRVSFDYPAHGLHETVLPQNQWYDRKLSLRRCAFC